VPDTVGLELHGQTSLCGIATRAKTCKDHRFQDLYRMLDAGVPRQLKHYALDVAEEKTRIQRFSRFRPGL